jgi:rsbT co-antagonist protein RsbR
MERLTSRPITAEAPMSTNGVSRLSEIIKKHESELLSQWMQEQKTNSRQAGLIKEQELRGQCAEFLGQLGKATNGDGMASAEGPQWNELRDMLGEVSRSRSQTRV